MGQAAFSSLGQYVLDIDCAVSSQDNAGRWWDIYWRVLIYKTSGTGRYSGADSGNSGWARRWPAGVDVWRASGFGYDFQTSSGVPVGGYVMFAQGVFRIYADGNGNGSYATDGGMDLVQLGSAYVTSGNKAAPRIPTVPPAPTVIDSQVLGRTSIRYRWAWNGDGGSAITSGTLQRARDAAFTTDVVTISNGSGDYTFTGLTPNTTYYFRVRANNGDGNGVWSTVYSNKTHDYPSKPVAPTVASVSATSISLATVDPANNATGITGREVQLSTLPSFSSIVATKTTSNPVFSAGDGVTRNTAYYARWRVQNIYGWSEYSDAVQTTTPGTPPSAPTAYDGFDIASTSFKVSTGAIADNGGAVPDGIRVKVSETASDAGLVYTYTQDAWAPVRVSALSMDQDFWVAEAAHNSAVGGGWGPYGAWVKVTTKNNAPAAPELSLDSRTDTTATLKWTAPSLLMGAVIQQYVVRIAEDPALLINAQQTIVDPSSLSQAFVGLTAGKTYYATVWTVTNNGLGSSSMIFSFSTTGTSPGSLLWLNVLGVWKTAEIWHNVLGVWKLVEFWHKVSGVWKKL